MDSHVHFEYDENAFCLLHTQNLQTMHMVMELNLKCGSEKELRFDRRQPSATLGNPRQPSATIGRSKGKQLKRIIASDHM